MGRRHEIARAGVDARSEERCARVRGARCVLSCAALAACAAACPCRHGRQARAGEGWRMADGPLVTRWAGDVSPERALPEYPRPTMVRDEWLNLNGLWDYAVTRAVDGKPPEWEGRILVPFPIESALSGVMRRFEPGQRLWYRRRYEVPREWREGRVLLHFGAVDWESTVYVNGKELGHHRGGYDSFSFDVTDALRREGEQEIVVSVLDPTDAGWQLRGKQNLSPGGCSYTPCSGIWQTVWLEPVPEAHVERLKMVTDVGAGALRLTVIGRMPPDPLTVRAKAFDGAREVAAVTAPAGGEIVPEVRKNLVDFYRATSTWFSVDLDLPIENARAWSPEDPFLYDLKVEIEKDGRALDSVKSYFGMRSIAVGRDENGNTRPLLNGKVLTMAGALDQGYWPDGIYTAPTDEALRYDVEAARMLGLNSVRKHVKAEPERWYYWCDRLGLLALQDMPTGSEGDPRTDMPGSPGASLQCEMEKRLLIRQLGNHPSIIMWILFNEGWGQHDTLRYARWAKELDPTRLVNEASGFPWHGGGDVVDAHGGVPPKDPRRIGITSETGGYGVSADGHNWSRKAWTYVTYDPATGGSTSGMEQDAGGRLPPLDDDSRRWMTQQVRGLFRSLWAGKDADGRSGLFLCQLVDVETECNGLLSYDRAVFKVDTELVAEACRGSEPPPEAAVVLPCALTRATTWRYTLDDPGRGWHEPGFDSSAWKEGPSGFGNPGTPGSKVGTEWFTGDIWLRKEFSLDEVPRGPLLRLHHDEDVQVYLNGVLALREGGFISTYDDFEMTPQAAGKLRRGENLLAVHCHQTGGGQYVDAGIVEPAGAARAAEPFSDGTFRWRNPIFLRGREGLRDPCIVREGDTYYLVFTVTPFTHHTARDPARPDYNSSPGIKLYTSKDLVNWEFEKWLVKSSDLPHDCPYKHRFWAPEIHRIGGRYYLIFTADNWIDDRHNPGGSMGLWAFVGVADRIDGPYEHITWIEGGCCDTTLLEAYDGKTYAIMPAHSMYAQEIDLTRLGEGRVRLLGERKLIVNAKNDDIGEDIDPAYLEGPWAIKRDGRYYLIIAANYEARGYWTSVAYADDPLGPWKKDERPFLFLGGHVAVFDGPDGRIWFSYRGEKYHNGLLCIDPVDIDADGRVRATGPSVGDRAVRLPGGGGAER